MYRIALAIFLAAIPLSSHAMDADEIVRKADLARGPSGSYIWKVTISHSEPGKTVAVSGYEVYVKGPDKVFVKFVSPARNTGRSLLALGRDVWIYLPDAGKPLRIPLAQRLVGQVANGDIARTDYAGDYTATLLGNEKVNGVECYVLDLKAKTKEVTYSAIKYFVARETFHPVKAEFYAGTGTLLKVGTFGEYREFGDRLRPTKLIFEDAVRKGVVSTMQFGDLRVRDLPEKYFNKNYMKNLD
ncbi:MAG: outer membrane lipoprotein-sorting protein [Candidatus Deferrimicrobiota bacterium]